MAQDQDQREEGLAESENQTPPIPQVSSRFTEKLMDTQWVAFGHRVTFTFVAGHEVGSVHFDRARHEIFLKGHNIRNMEIETWQWQILEKMRDVLKSHPKLRNFINPYSRLLDKIYQEKAKQLP